MQLRKDNQLKKLNFGCGSIQPEGWINIDFDQSFNAPVKHLGEIEDNFADLIVAHCTLQITDWRDLNFLLKDLLRVLKPSGIIRISLPDIETGFWAYFDGHKEWFPNGEGNLDDRFCAWLTWYSTSKTLLTPKALGNKLKEAGFSTYRRSGFKTTELSTKEIIELDTREGECYFMEAQK